jgi:uncharacterized phage infection (PIP) family protein YhgE
MPKALEKETASVDERQPKIMTKPLPEILDELEDYIRRVEEAVKQAQAAAKESRQAAAQAKESGEKAADAAKKAADATVAKVREEATRGIDAANDRIAVIESDLQKLKDDVTQEVIAIDRAFLAAKDSHVEQSPFFQR